MIGGFDKNFSYFLGDEETREIFVVDPDNAELLNELIAEEGLEVVGVVITHEHHDHVAGVKEMVEKYKVPVFIHEAGRGVVEEILGDEGGDDVIKTIEDGEVLSVGEVEIKVMHTPGHTAGAVCLLSEGKLICGDTLFVGGCGRCDFAGSDVNEMYKSLYEKIWNLPDETEIYPGHDYGQTPSSTLKKEKKENRFLKCENKEEFVKMRMG